MIASQAAGWLSKRGTGLGGKDGEKYPKESTDQKRENHDFVRRKSQLKPCRGLVVVVVVAGGAESSVTGAHN